MTEFDIREDGLINPCGCDTVMIKDCVDWLARCKNCDEHYILNSNITPDMTEDELVSGSLSLIKKINKYKEFYYITLAQLETLQKNIEIKFPEYEITTDELIKKSIIKELLLRIKSMTEDVKSTNKKLIILEEQNTKKNKEIIEKDLKIKFLIVSMEEFKKSGKHYKDEIKQLELDNKNYKKKYENFELKNRKYQSEIKDIHIFINKLKKKIDSGKKEIETIQKEHKKQIESIQKEHKEKIESMQKEHKKQIEEIQTESKEKIESMQEVNSDLLEKMNELAQQYLALNNTNSHNYQMASNLNDLLRLKCQTDNYYGY